MKPTHSPGPWFTARRGPDCSFAINIYAKRGAAIANVIDFGCAEQVNQYEKPNAEQAANARLMAAAPDLLDACRDLLDALEAMPPDYVSAPYTSSRIFAARAAVRKATAA